MVMKKILLFLLDWPMLAFWAGAIAWVAWPWANHWVSYFWFGVIASVLIGELLNKFFSPKKQTLSNNVQDEVKDSPVRFWTHLVLWLIFSLTLAGHFCLRLF